MCRDRVVRFVLAVAIAVAFAFAGGCAGGTSTGQKKAEEDLAAAKDAIEVATSDEEVEEAIGTCLTIAEQLPGTAVGDDAYATAEAAVTGFSSPEYLFVDRLPGELDIAGVQDEYDAMRLRALVGFATLVPTPYADRTASALTSVAAEVGADWCDRLDDVANDRISWARTMRKKKRAGNYDRIVDYESERLAYQRKVLDAAEGVDEVRDAFASIASAVAYSVSTEPRSGKTDVTADSITSYYDPAVVKKAEATGKTLLARSKAARQALEDAAGTK